MFLLLIIPLQELRTLKTISNDNSLPFITTCNPNSPNAYEMIDKPVECLKRNKKEGIDNLRAIKSKRQAPNLKKIPSKAEFSQKQVGVYKCPGKICECCASLLLGNSYIVKYVDKTFKLKTHFSCHSSNLLYIIIWPICGEEYTVETRKSNSETVSEPIDNISGNFSIKNSRQKNIGERVVMKVPLKSFLYFRCGALKLTYVGVTKEISWKNTKQN